MNLPPFNHPLRRAGDETEPTPALRRMAVSATALLLTLLLGRAAMQRFDAPVHELAITGALRHVQPDEVRQAAAPLLDTRLFELDLAALRAAVEGLPWVAHARIDRQWPARLRVRITEREPFARWGENQALSTEGVVFAPGDESLPGSLPQLYGAPGREREVMAMYGQLADRLSETRLAITRLAQDARGEWTGSTAEGIKLRFGHESPLLQVPRLKDTVLPALSSRFDAVKGIDLRYANGFAVSWLETGEARPQQVSSNTTMSDAAPAEPATPGETP